MFLLGVNTVNLIHYKMRVSKKEERYMTELTLLLLIVCCFVTCVAVAYWFDKRIVKNIKELEEYQIKKGIIKKYEYDDIKEK